MPEFRSYRSYSDFASSITRESRYIRTAAQEEFLAAVLETSDIRKEVIPQGAVLWRAQIGHHWDSVDIHGEADEEPCPFSPERMKPLANQASEGRANPRGIPYLYLATELNTAVSEVRPWVGVRVSVAQFKVNRELTIVNFSKEERRLIIYGAEPDAPERERAVWRDINYAFSKPITQNELRADHVPTQVLAELLKQRNFDGIGYKSSLAGC